jgi:hypothetical protein
VHWHGLRLENRYDGTHETQAPIPVGGASPTACSSPTRAYWYHPHIREDYGQEMGLYGNVLVEPADPDYWPPAHRELALTLDDVLIEDGQIAPFSRARRRTRRWAASATCCSSRRAELALTARARRGRALLPDQHRQHARVQGRAARRADEARRRRQRPLSSTSSSSRRRPRAVRARRRRRAVRRSRASSTLEHRTPERTYRSPRSRSSDEPAEPSLAERSRSLRTTPSWRPSASGSPRTWTRAGQDARVRRRDGHGREPEGGAGRLRLPDAPRGRQRGAGPLPECGMKLLPTARADDYVCPMHPEVVSEEPGTARVRHEAAAGAARRASPAARRRGHTRRARRPRTRRHARRRHATTHATTTARHRRRGSSGRTTWSRSTAHDAGEHALEAVDRSTGAENHAIDWRSGRRPGEDPAGQRDGLRPPDAPPVPHPRRRPLPVLARDGVRRAEPGLEGHGAGAHRRDVDILLDVTNPGRGWRTATSPSTTRAG